jgi:hypothetical protein
MGEDSLSIYLGNSMVCIKVIKASRHSSCGIICSASAKVNE